MNEFLSMLGDFIPKFDKLLVALGGIGGAIAWAVGGFDPGMQWLCVFIAADYLTGNLAAFKTGAWSSNDGFKGIIKKVVILALVAICNGVDQVTGAEVVRTVAISSLCLNEAGSILENLDRLGFGGVIPSGVRKCVKQLREKTEGSKSDE